jgi:phage terminase small subunit
LKILTGNPGKRPLPQHEPQPSPALPVPPSDLTSEARQLWEVLAAELVSHGLLTKLDVVAFEALIRTWERWQREIAAGSSARLQIQLQTELSRWCSHFGLSPATRSRVTVAEPEPDENDPAVRWLRRGKGEPPEPPEPAG